MNKISKKIKIDTSINELSSLQALSEEEIFIDENNNIVSDSSSGNKEYISFLPENDNSQNSLFETFIIDGCFDELRGNEPGNYFKSYHQFQYNYYNSNYENSLTILEEKELPNIYFIQNQYSPGKLKETFSDKTTWDGLFGKTQIKNFITNPPNYEINDYLSDFPYYCKIQFDGHKKINGGFLDLLNTTGHLNVFFNTYVNQALTSIRSINLDQSPSTNDIDSAFILNNEKIFIDFQSQFPSELNTFLLNNRISIKDIQDGIESYSEIIGYKIEKFRTKDAIRYNSVVYDTIYLPNTGDSTQTFIDTEIFFNKNYTYKVYAIVFSISSKLSLKTVYTDSARTNARQILINDVLPNITEVLISNFSNMLSLDPPLPPQVEILPYIPSNKEKKTEIKFNFTLSSGEKIEMPVMIDSNLQSQLGKIRQVQNRQDDKILYSDRDEITEILVYRLDKAPLSFDDFKSLQQIEITQRKNYGNFIINLSLSRDRMLYKSTSLVDKIISNKKFYYTFRTLSVHGFLSNPEIVYEIEFLEDKGNIYPSIKIHDFKKEINKYNKESASFAKNFLVEPAPVQTLIRPGSIPTNVNVEANTFSGIKPGIAQKAIWGKKMKFRIISKSTGRKIDINVIFDYKLGK